MSAICHLQSPRNGSTGQVPPRFSDWCNDEASVLEVILGRQVGQREDTACDEDGVDVSLGVGIVVGSPPPHFPRLLGSPSEIWESDDFFVNLRMFIKN